MPSTVRFFILSNSPIRKALTEYAKFAFSAVSTDLRNLECLKKIRSIICASRQNDGIFYNAEI